jgi:hypothetical protein
MNKREKNETNTKNITTPILFSTGRPSNWGYFVVFEHFNFFILQINNSKTYFKIKPFGYTNSSGITK